MPETKIRTYREHIALMERLDADDTGVLRDLEASIREYYGPDWVIESFDGQEVAIAMEGEYQDVSEDLRAWACDLRDKIPEESDTIRVYIAAAYRGLADFSHLGRAVGFAHQKGGDGALSTWINLHFRRMASEMRLLAEGESDRGDSLSLNREIAYCCDKVRQTEEITEGTVQLRSAVAQASEEAGMKGAAELIAQIRVPEHRIAEALEEMPAADLLLTAAAQANDDHDEAGFSPLSRWRRHSEGWWAAGLHRVMRQLASLLEERVEPNTSREEERS